MDCQNALCSASREKNFKTENQLISIKKNLKTQYLKNSHTFATEIEALWQRI